MKARNGPCVDGPPLARVFLRLCFPLTEALACGTPVAAYPVTGPIDILTPKTGAMSINLEAAIIKAKKLRGEDCIKLANQFNWTIGAQQFRDGLVPSLRSPNT